jgi:hypothetical protein
VGDNDEQISMNGTSVGLGPNAEGQSYGVAVGWDQATNTVWAELRDASGNLLVDHTDVVIEPDILNAQTMTHLGWSDYTSNDNETKVFEIQADELRYFIDLDLADYASFAECLSGPDVAPDPVSPPPDSADCLKDFDFDADDDVDAEDFAAFQAAFRG